MLYFFVTNFSSVAGLVQATAGASGAKLELLAGDIAIKLVLQCRFSPAASCRASPAGVKHYGNCLKTLHFSFVFTSKHEVFARLFFKLILSEQ